MLLSLGLAAQSNPWVLTFGSKNADQATAITADTKGDVLAAGIISDTATFTWRGTTFNLLPWRGNCFITKQDASGQLIWLRHIGGSGNIHVKDIATDVYDNFYITGSFSGTADFDPTSNSVNLTSASALEDVFVAKYDNWGNFIWAKKVGGAGSDRASSIFVSGDSTVFIAGGFEGAVDFDPGVAINQVVGNTVQDAFLLSLDHAGNFKSAYTFGGAGSDLCTDLEMDGQGNLVVSGNFSQQVDFNPTSSVDTLTSFGALDAFILKVDTSFNFIWVKQIGGALNGEIRSIAIDANNKIYAVGAFRGTCDFDPSSTTNQLTAENTDGFVVQLTSSGAFSWSNRIGGKSDDEAIGIAIDQLYNIYVTGYFQDTVDFDPDTTASLKLTAQGNSDHFIYQLDTASNFVSVQQYTGNVQSVPNRIYTNNNIIYTAGSFTGTVDFDASAAVANRTVVGQNDIFIQRHMPSSLVTVFELIEKKEGNIVAYPNPTQNELRINLQNVFQMIDLRVYNAHGGLVREYSYTNTQLIHLDLEIESGVYFVELILNKTHRETMKMIKE